MKLSKLFTNSVNVLKLQKEAMEEVLDAPLSHGLLILALVSLLAALGYVFFPVQAFDGVSYRPDLMWVLGRTLVNFLFYFLSFGLIGLLAERIFGSKVEVQDFLNVMMHASLAGALLLIPQLLPAVLLWWLFVMHELLVKPGHLGKGAALTLICIQILFSLAVGYHYFPFSG